MQKAIIFKTANFYEIVYLDEISNIIFSSKIQSRI